MPFIINNIDTAMTVIEVTVKVLKFIGTVLHYLALLIGAFLIITGVGIIRLVAFIEGKAPTLTEVAEAEHGPALIDGTPSSTTASKRKAKAPAKPRTTTKATRVQKEVVAPVAPVAARRARKGTSVSTLMEQSPAVAS